MRVLVASPFPPRRDAPHGGARALAGLVTSLAGVHDVALVTLRASDEPTVDADVASVCDLVVEVDRERARRSPAAMWRERQRVGLTLAAAPSWVVAFSVSAFGRRLERAVEQWRPDIVQLEFAVMAQYAARCHGRPVVVVDHDVDGSPSLDRFRRSMVSDVDALVAFTERDRAALAALVPQTRSVRIPLGFDVPSEPLDPVGNGRDVLFVGSFLHPPNVDAAERLVDAIFPRIAAVRPDARLVLVGPDPPRRLNAKKSERVAVAGRVEDVRPILDSAAVVVAPLARGGGMRVKVLEALGAGKAVVATALAVEGLTIEAGIHALVADEDEAFAGAVAELLADDLRRRRLGVAARAWAETHGGWDMTVERFNRLYASLVGEAA